MAERKGKKSQKKAEQVQEMPVLAKNKQDVLELGELDQYYFGEGTHYDIYKKLGGFVEKTIFNEDMIYAAGLIHAGYGIAYAADAKVVHSHNYSRSQQFHRNFDLGVSQAQYPEIFDGVPSEGEGLRLVKKTFSYLVKHGKWYLIPGFIIQSGCKYAGYFMGKRYKKLSKKMILRCTMNQTYWNESK